MTHIRKRYYHKKKKPNPELPANDQPVVSSTVIPNPVPAVTTQPVKTVQERRPVVKEIRKETQFQPRVMHSNQTISVIIPLLNEEESLNELSLSLEKVFAQMKCNYEVIFVDDGSTDKSFLKIREISRRNNKIHCIIN